MSEAPAETAKRRRTILSWLVAISLAGLLLWLALRGVDWRQLGAVVSSARWTYLAAACVLGSIAHFLRALRWRVILSTARPLPAGMVFWATMAGYFGNNLLPARAGELLRSALVSTRAGLPMSFVLTTALAERFADAIVLVLLSAVLLLFLEAGPRWLSEVSRGAAVAAGAGLGTLAVLPSTERFAIRLIKKLPLPEAVCLRLASVVAQVAAGIRSFHSPRRFLCFGTYTVAIWLLDAFGCIVVAAGLGLHMPLAIALLLLTALGLSSALPSTPGYVGIYQFVAVSVLTPFGFSRAAALAYILVAQALGYAIILVFGGIGLWRYRPDRP